MGAGASVASHLGLRFEPSLAPWAGKTTYSDISEFPIVVPMELSASSGDKLTEISKSELAREPMRVDNLDLGLDATM